jgi:uncharacterized membrane protein
MAYASTTTDSSTADPHAALRRERLLSMIGGVLGLLMFIWGFLRWLNVGDGADQAKYSGYAFGMPTSAVVGFSLAAGLMAFLGATERRPGRGVPSAIPTAMAATSLLLAIAIFLGKGAISPTLGSEVGVEIGLVLALVTAVLQTIVLGMGLMSRHDDDRSAGSTRSPR